MNVLFLSFFNYSFQDRSHNSLLWLYINSFDIIQLSFSYELNLLNDMVYFKLTILNCFLLVYTFSSVMLINYPPCEAHCAVFDHLLYQNVNLCERYKLVWIVDWLCLIANELCVRFSLVPKSYRIDMIRLSTAFFIFIISFYYRNYRLF